MSTATIVVLALISAATANPLLGGVVVIGGVCYDPVTFTIKSNNGYNRGCSTWMQCPTGTSCLPDSEIYKHRLAAVGVEGWQEGWEIPADETSTSTFTAPTATPSTSSSSSSSWTSSSSTSSSSAEPEEPQFQQQADRDGGDKPISLGMMAAIAGLVIAVVVMAVIIVRRNNSKGAADLDQPNDIVQPQQPAAASRLGQGPVVTARCDGPASPKCMAAASPKLPAKLAHRHDTARRPVDSLQQTVQRPAEPSQGTAHTARRPSGVLSMLNSSRTKSNQHAGGHSKFILSNDGEVPIENQINAADGFKTRIRLESVSKAGGMKVIKVAKVRKTNPLAEYITCGEDEVQLLWDCDISNQPTKPTEGMAGAGPMTGCTRLQQLRTSAYALPSPAQPAADFDYLFDDESSLGAPSESADDDASDIVGPACDKTDEDERNNYVEISSADREAATTLTMGVSAPLRLGGQSLCQPRLSHQAPAYPEC
jgi:hypothetical protein